MRLDAFPYVLCQRRMPGWRDQSIPVSCQSATPPHAAASMMTLARRWTPCEFSDLSKVRFRVADERMLRAKWQRAREKKREKEIYIYIYIYVCAIV
jgi:hypothetical protein